MTYYEHHFRSNLSLSDNDSPHCGETDMNLGFYNMTYSSDEENKPKKNKQGYFLGSHAIPLVFVTSICT
jgi:hypothetical protein